MITAISGQCQYPECDQPATCIACRRSCEGAVACYCLKHALVVQDEGDPEYLETCPNCGCMFGVN